MSLEPDVLDEEIRVVLLRAPVASIDTATVLERVQARARRRRLRHRGTVLVASVAAAGLAAALVNQEPGDSAVVTDATTSSTLSTTPEYGLPPLTPLVDEPLSRVPRTELEVRNGHVFTAEVSAKGLILALSDPSGATGSTWADPQTMPAITYGGTGPSSQDPHPMDYLMGATRPEVTRIELITGSETYSVDTFASDAFPQLRFFLIEAAPGTLVPGPDSPTPPARALPRLSAYAADGALLTDTQRIQDESAAFAREVDRRNGVEDEPAAIVSAIVQPDDQSVALAIANCGAEVSVTWTVEVEALTVAATVKRTHAEGPCLSGETTTITIGLEAPLAGRALIDARTGTPIPTGR